MKIKEKRDYAFKEFLKGRTLKEICKDIDPDTNAPIMSFSYITKLSSREKWVELRREYIQEAKNDIKNQLLAEELNFSKRFLKSANDIIDMTLNNLASTGFRDEKALVQFLKFLEDYKDKVAGIEETINIKHEIVSNDEQLALLTNIANSLAEQSEKEAEKLNDYFDEE